VGSEQQHEEGNAPHEVANASEQALETGHGDSSLLFCYRWC
jgi:hypothetical protein